MPAKVVRIPLDKAASRIQALLKVNPSGTSPVHAAAGRCLAEDLKAAWPLPTHDISHMDGYAVRSVDLVAAAAGSPVVLNVVGISRPDDLGAPPIAASSCARVLTGGRIPAGADAVVPQELVSRVDGRASFMGRVEPYAHVHRAGSDVREGTLLFSRGRLLDARDISFLLSYGLSEISVCPTLRVGVLATGSELVESARGMAVGKIPESNRMVLAEILGQTGFDVIDLGIAKDDPVEIAATLKRGVERCDAVLTTGGSSVSEADLVPDALGLLGGIEVFHGLLLRPSRTMGAFFVGDVPVFLLSGLIQASVSALFNVVYPSLKFMQGLGWQLLPSVKASLVTSLESRGDDPYRRVIWVRVTADGGRLLAKPAAAASTTRFVLTYVNGFFMAEPGEALTAGELVDVMIPPGFGIEAALGGR